MKKRRKIEYKVADAMMGREQVYVDFVNVFCSTFWAVYSKNPHWSFAVLGGYTKEQWLRLKDWGIRDTSGGKKKVHLVNYKLNIWENRTLKNYEGKCFFPITLVSIERSKFLNTPTISFSVLLLPTEQE